MINCIHMFKDKYTNKHIITFEHFNNKRISFFIENNNNIRLTYLKTKNIPLNQIKLLSDILNMKLLKPNSYNLNKNSFKTFKSNSLNELKLKLI